MDLKTNSKAEPYGIPAIMSVQLPNVYIQPIFLS